MRDDLRRRVLPALTHALFRGVLIERHQCLQVGGLRRPSIRAGGEVRQNLPHARVVGSADGVNDALEGMRALQPRVLILDIQLRGGSGFRLLKLMRAAGMTRPETIIVVTNYPSDDYRTASRECGADHFFDKASEFHKVREVLLEMR